MVLDEADVSSYIYSIHSEGASSGDFLGSPPGIVAVRMDTRIRLA